MIGSLYVLDNDFTFFTQQGISPTTLGGDAIRLPHKSIILVLETIKSQTKQTNLGGYKTFMLVDDFKMLVLTTLGPLWAWKMDFDHFASKI